MSLFTKNVEQTMTDAKDEVVELIQKAEHVVKGAEATIEERLAKMEDEFARLKAALEKTGVTI